MKKNFISCLLAAIAVAGCRKPYDPPAIIAPNNYLVVEGNINSGGDSTYIKLSRTVNLSSSSTTNPELHATVSVQGDQNTSYPLKETGNGNYSCAGLNLDNTHSYRLSIKTANNEQYLSAYEPVVNSPPIDSISWDTKGALGVPGLNIYANTHDPTAKVLYYRWTYNETWQLHSNFPSCCYSNGDSILVRNQLTMNITTCWANDTASNIIIGSSAKLSKDIILNQPITKVVSTSEKVEDQYSILVTQYALTPDAYTFYTNLKTNSEQLGSIFDAEPSQINGNITCVTHPSEPVVGYIGVGAPSSLRIFIFNQQLPNWKTIPYYSNCSIYVVGNGNILPHQCCSFDYDGYNEVNQYINYLSPGFLSGYPQLPLIPVAPISLPGHPPTGYTAAIRPCVDCTLRGASVKPSFWP